MSKQYQNVLSAAGLAAGLWVAGRAVAGSLDPTNAPGPTMHTLEEIYQKVQNLAPQTLQTLSAATDVVAAGYYAATNLTQVDSDLAAANIAAGTAIFGVTGTAGVATGNATAAQVLAGRTFSTAGASGLTGTMVSNAPATITPGTSPQTIAQGYHNGSGSVAGDADLTAGNIRAGVNIFGVAGTVAGATGNATAAQVLAGRTFSTASASGLTGTMVSNAPATITPGTSPQTIAQGYHNGSGAVAGDADLVTGNIRAGVNVFGVAGKTEVVDTTSGNAVAGDVKLSKVAWVDGVAITGTIATLTLSATTSTVAAGYYAATNLVQVDADLITGRIHAGVSLFGVAGKTEVVDTTTGNAAAGDLLIGKKAWVDGFEITGTSYPAPVPKTGQTISVVAKDDGAYQKGVASPSPRFTAGTGTSSNCVTDNLTGLMWLKTPDNTNRNWEDAITYCEGLNGGSGRGGHSDWRLPNVRELYALLDLGQNSPALPVGHPFVDVWWADDYGYYWSGTSFAANQSDYAWVVGVCHGYVGYGYKPGEYFTWPVRGGR